MPDIYSKLEPHDSLSSSSGYSSSSLPRNSSRIPEKSSRSSPGFPAAATVAVMKNSPSPLLPELSAHESQLTTTTTTTTKTVEKKQQKAKRPSDAELQLSLSPTKSLPQSVQQGEESFPTEVKRRCLSRQPSVELLYEISNIPEDLSLCHCDPVCETEVEVKHVHLAPKEEEKKEDRSNSSQQAQSQSQSPSRGDAASPPPQAFQPIKVLGVFKVKVCHHPQCTEENNKLPLLLCRQCDTDIHRQPQYAGHLVLDSAHHGNNPSSPSKRTTTATTTTSTSTSASAANLKLQRASMKPLQISY
ncbi:uncharacterized protein LOC143301996 [Babylonia areolata]|uniref:uncharacterized protein LOC143301996 n=1 Tax=Babylonia areolata TaxID=304850 RepID=UPI003FD167A7